MHATANKKKLRTFHGHMQVTRLEEWSVEAETAEQAKKLLAAGQGHRRAPGDSIHAEFVHLLED